MLQSLSPALSGSFLAALFILHAACLNILLAHGNYDASATGTTDTTGVSGSSRTDDELCTTASVYVRSDLRVLEKCVCEEAEEDYYDDDSYAVVIKYANGSTVVENYDYENRSASEVLDGRLCKFSENGSAGGKTIHAGVCKSGKCIEENITSYHVTTTPEPVYDPNGYRCRVSTSPLNSKLQVADGCVASCFNPHKGWKNQNLDDGRLCHPVNGSADNHYSKRSGVCRKGICVNADREPKSRLCQAKHVRRNGIVLVEKCTITCKNHKKALVRDGTRCLLNYERKVSAPGVDNVIVDGICKHGHCIITPPTIPLLTVQVPEEGCSHFWASINYTHRVESTCKALCHGHERYKTLKPGTPCALHTHRKWPTVKEVGECIRGSCVQKDPMETPPPHEKVNPKSINCRDRDYVTVEPRLLTVVASCQVECSYFMFEPRKDGVQCLLEYTVTNNGKKTYTVGVCKDGYCTLGKYPRNITTQN